MESHHWLAQTGQASFPLIGRVLQSRKSALCHARLGRCVEAARRMPAVPIDGFALVTATFRDASTATECRIPLVPPAPRSLPSSDMSARGGRSSLLSSLQPSMTGRHRTVRHGIWTEQNRARAHLTAPDGPIDVHLGLAQRAHPTRCRATRSRQPHFGRHQRNGQGLASLRRPGDSTPLRVGE